MEFSKRLFEIMLERNISNAELSRESGISTARLSNFYNGKDMPSIKNAFKLVNYFSCTFNYLFGLSDENVQINEKRQYVFETFYKRLNVLLSINLISQRKLCKEIGINKACISNWRNGQNPKTRNLVKIAKRLNCSIDYLLGF